MPSPPFPRAGSAPASLLSAEPHSGDPHPRAPIDNVELAKIAQAKLEEAYRTHKQRLHRLLRYDVGDDAASDIIQDAFLRMAKTGRVHQINEPIAFVWRIARNLTIERWRRQKIETLTFLPIEEGLDVPVAAEQEAGLELADLRQLYKEAVESLPDKTRYVFMMCRIDGMSHKDISAELGITIRTVEYHMGKALAHLARVMDPAR